MDTLSLGLITVAVASAATFFIYLFSTLGARSTFEDAIKEQKERAEELLGKRPLPHHERKKSKEHHKKKNKKIEREKVASSVSAAIGPAAAAAATVAAAVPAASSQKVAFTEKPAAEKHHVAIVDEAEVITPSAARKPSISIRRESIKSILLNKDEPVVTLESNTIENHFEEIHPKDDLELRMAHVTQENKAEVEDVSAEVEEVTETRVTAPLQNSAPPSALEKKPPSQNQQPVTEKVVKATKASAQAVAVAGGGGTGKREKVDLKKLIVATSLSTEEVQGLIEALLNKSGSGGSAGSPEWVQPRSDAVSTLRKQLTQFEDQLKSEQNNSVALQNKLRDLRAENSDSKQRWTGSVRKLEMELGNKNAELSGVVGVLNGLKREVGQLNSVNQTLRDEKIIVQKSLQAETSKRADLESQLTASLQHASHLEAQLAHAFNSNQEISAQLHSLQLNYKAALEKYSMDEVNLRQQWEQERVGMGEREGFWGGRVKELETRVKELETQGEDSVSSLHNAKNTIQNLTVQLDEVKECAKAERAEFERREAELGKKSSLASSDLESELGSLKSGLGEARLALSGAQAELTDMQSELNVVRTANEELREKNTKLSSHLNESERRFEDAVQKKDKVLVDSLSELSSVLGLELSESNWISVLEQRVKDLESSGKSDEKKLQDEVAHYQQVLAGTETLLSNLQRSLEAEEGAWKKSLSEKDAHIKELESRLSEEESKSSSVPAPPVIAPAAALAESPSASEKALLERIKELEIELASSSVPRSPGGEDVTKNGSSSNGGGSSPVSGQSPSPSPAEKKKKKGLGGLFSSKSKA